MPYSCFHKQYVNTLSRVLIKRAVTTGVTDSNIVESDGADIITKTSKLLAIICHAMDKIV